MTAAANSSEGETLVRQRAPCRVVSAEHFASKASDIGAQPSQPLAAIETPRALMAEGRRLLSPLPTSSGSTSIQEPHIRDCDTFGSSERRGSSLAGAKFWTQNEMTSRSGQHIARVGARPGVRARCSVGSACCLSFSRLVLEF